MFAWSLFFLGGVCGEGGGNTKSLMKSCAGFCQEKFLDTKEVISDRKTKKDRQYNVQ